MCCIFTCCGWVIDLVQRLWTFAMACCIAAAVCCSLIIASLSGIALGYNYSLAEYIDLKETNVSVYLKRGVFDDDIVDDMDWRRSGHLPVKGLINEDNLVTPAQNAENPPLRAGRRMDDSIFESDDHHRFEGSLMKLTAKPVHHVTDATQFTSESLMSEINNFEAGSLDQLKAVQAIINRRKMDSARYSTHKRDKPTTPLDEFDEQNLLQFPERAGKLDPNGWRRNYPPNYVNNGEPPAPGPGESARNAVPSAAIGEPYKWMNPKLPYDKLLTIEPYEDPNTYPPPVTPRPGPLRPTRPPPPKTYPTSASTSSAATNPITTTAADIKELLDDDLESFKEKLLVDSPIRSQDFLDKIKGSKKSDVEDYDEDIKGLPVRRKRHLHEILLSNSNDSTAASHQINNQTIVDNGTVFNESENNIFNVTERNFTASNIIINTTNFEAKSNDTNAAKIPKIPQSKETGLLNKIKSVFSYLNHEAARKTLANENNDTKLLDYLVLFDE